MPSYVVWPENITPQTADAAQYGIGAFDVEARDPRTAAKRARELNPGLAKERLAVAPSRYVVFTRRPLDPDWDGRPNQEEKE